MKAARPAPSEIGPSKELYRQFESERLFTFHRYSASLSFIIYRGVGGGAKTKEKYNEEFDPGSG